MRSRTSSIMSTRGHRHNPPWGNGPSNADLDGGQCVGPHAFESSSQAIISVSIWPRRTSTGTRNRLRGSRSEIRATPCRLQRQPGKSVRRSVAPTDYLKGRRRTAYGDLLLFNAAGQTRKGSRPARCAVCIRHARRAIQTRQNRLPPHEFTPSSEIPPENPQRLAIGTPSRHRPGP